MDPRDVILQQTISDVIAAQMENHQAQINFANDPISLAALQSKDMAMCLKLDDLFRARVQLANGLYINSQAQISAASTQITAALVGLQLAVQTAQNVIGIMSFLDQILLLAAAIAP